MKALSEGLVKLGEKSKNVVVLNADFDSKTGVGQFAQAFGDRYFNFGLAEANMMGASIGFVVRGKMPFVVGYGNFLGKCWDIVRNGICYPNLNVKIIGVDPGDEQGGYCAKESVDLMKALPNMKIFYPADYDEALKALKDAFDEYGPCYVRIE